MTSDERKLHECPQCGSKKVDQEVDLKRSKWLQNEVVGRKADRGAKAILALVAAPFTLGLSTAAFGAWLLTDSATRALTSNGRDARVQAEARRCAIMTCRICQRKWLMEDWDDICALRGDRNLEQPTVRNSQKGQQAKTSTSSRAASGDDDFTLRELFGDD